MVSNVSFLTSVVFGACLQDCGDPRPQYSFVCVCVCVGYNMLALVNILFCQLISVIS